MVFKLGIESALKPLVHRAFVGYHHTAADHLAFVLDQEELSDVLTESRQEEINGPEGRLNLRAIEFRKNFVPLLNLGFATRRFRNRGGFLELALAVVAQFINSRIDMEIQVGLICEACGYECGFPTRIIVEITGLEVNRRVNE